MQEITLPDDNPKDTCGVCGFPMSFKNPNCNHGIPKERVEIPTETQYLPNIQSPTKFQLVLAKKDGSNDTKVLEFTEDKENNKKELEEFITSAKTLLEAIDVLPNEWKEGDIQSELAKVLKGIYK
jgi:hypothetical protein